jgi:hypothetical protein
MTDMVPRVRAWRFVMALALAALFLGYCPLVIAVARADEPGVESLKRQESLISARHSPLD